MGRIQRPCTQRPHLRHGDTPTDVAELGDQLRGKASAFFDHGTRDPDVFDRSSSLMRFAYLLNEHDNPTITPSQAFALVREADRRHGQKFMDRPDGDDQMWKMVDRAYGR